MESFNKDEDRVVFTEIIQGLFLDFSPVISWEVRGDTSRQIHPVKIAHVDNDNETLNFTLAEESEFKFSTENIFFFSEEQKVIFKSPKQSIDGNQLTVSIPDVIKRFEGVDEAELQSKIEYFKQAQEGPSSDPFADFNLDDDTVTDKQNDPLAGLSVLQGAGTENIQTNWITKSMSTHDAELFTTELSYIKLDEEDKKFEGVRSTPRAKPPEGKMVTVQISDESLPQATYTLYDLSQGGLSFLVFAKDEFNTGDQLIVKAFDTKKFESPMNATIRAITEADDMGIQYKVGCEFISLEE